MVHSGIGTQYDCQFVLARKSRNHKTAWVVDGIVVFPGILARELVSSSTYGSMASAISYPKEVGGGRYSDSVDRCVSDISNPYLAVQDG